VEFCGNGSVYIALIPDRGDKQAVQDYLNALGPGRRYPGIVERLPPVSREFLAALKDVHYLRSYPNIFVLRFKTGLAREASTGDLQRILESLFRLPLAQESNLNTDARGHVELEPSLRLHLHANPPNDPVYAANTQPNQWGLRDLGIKAGSAWDRVGMVSTLQPTTVGILDTGVAVVGEELEASALINGADYSVNPPVFGNPGDVDGHGTNVASIVAARTNNGQGIAGVTWSGQQSGRAAVLMPVRVIATANSSPDDPEKCTHNLLHALPYLVDLDSAAGGAGPGSGTLWDLARLPDSAVKPVMIGKGASIANLSAGFSACSTVVGRAMQRIEQFFPAVLFVVAVPDRRNSPNVNIDGDPPAPDYPTSYSFSNVLTVTATGKGHCVTEKYGKVSVDIVAPGSDILPLSPNGEYLFYESGTSLAAPHVSGAAALLKALAPTDWQSAQVKQDLLDSSDMSMCKSPPDRDIQAATCVALSGNAQWPSICDGVHYGLLDLDAATAPPVMDIVPVKNATRAHAWSTGKPAAIAWKKKFPSDLCKQVDADLIVDQADATNPSKSPTVVRLSSSPLDVAAGTAAFDASTMARVASDGIPSGAESATARVRLQCVGSNMFRLSGDFTVRKPD
jgi:subtilisin family serine protease